MPGGKARQYMFPQAVKSAIVKPSFGLAMAGPGLYEISGASLVRGGTNPKSRSFRGWRKDVGGSRARRPGAAESPDPIPAPMDMGWRARSVGEPRHR